MEKGHYLQLTLEEANNVLREWAKREAAAIQGSLPLPKGYITVRHEDHEGNTLSPVKVTITW